MLRDVCLISWTTVMELCCKPGDNQCVIFDKRGLRQAS